MKLLMHLQQKKKKNGVNNQLKFLNLIILFFNFHIYSCTLTENETYLKNKYEKHLKNEIVDIDRLPKELSEIVYDYANDFDPKKIFVKVRIIINIVRGDPFTDHDTKCECDTHIYNKFININNLNDKIADLKNYIHEQYKKIEFDNINPESIEYFDRHDFEWCWLRGLIQGGHKRYYFKHSLIFLETKLSYNDYKIKDDDDIIRFFPCLRFNDTFNEFTENYFIQFNMEFKFYCDYVHIKTSSY